MMKEKEDDCLETDLDWSMTAPSLIYNLLICLLTGMSQTTMIPTQRMRSAWKHIKNKSMLSERKMVA